MESGKFPAVRCRGAACRSRHNAGDWYRLPIKRYTPIASVAAVSDRHGGWQCLRHIFCGEKPSSLSLRGRFAPVAISGRQLRFGRSLSHDSAGYCEIAPQGHFLALRAQGATSAFGLLAMTNLGAGALGGNAPKPATANGGH